MPKGCRVTVACSSFLWWSIQHHSYKQKLQMTAQFCEDGKYIQQIEQQIQVNLANLRAVITTCVFRPRQIPELLCCSRSTLNQILYWLKQNSLRRHRFQMPSETKKACPLGWGAPNTPRRAVEANLEWQPWKSNLTDSGLPVGWHTWVRFPWQWYNIPRGQHVKERAPREFPELS